RRPVEGAMRIRRPTALVLAVATMFAAGCSMNSTFRSSPQLTGRTFARTSPNVLYPIGSIYVADNPGFNKGSIVIFAANATGNATPIGVITGINTQLSAPYRPVIDSTGRIIVPSAGIGIQIWAPGA